MNVLAELPGGSGPVLLLGAHYDRVERGLGAIDNAAGAAVVLQLAEALLREPIPGYTVRLAFWDLEEVGLLGSRAWVEDQEGGLPDLYINFDIFVWGDAFWLMAEDEEAALPAALREAADAAALRIFVDEAYPPSDHLSFRNTTTTPYALSLLDAAGVEALLASFRGEGTPAETPRIFEIMHTERDTPDELDPEAVARGVSAVEEALRIFARRPNGAR